MKRLRRIGLIVLALVVQLFLVLALTVRGVNVAKIPYRLAERAAVAKTYSQDPSPENKAALRRELMLASRHDNREQLGKAAVVFIVLVSLETFCLWKEHDKKPRVAN